MENAIRSLDSVKVGDSLPELVEHVDMVTNFIFGVSLWTAHRLHYDHVLARDEGFEAPVIPGALMSAYATRVLVDWAGDPRLVRRIYSRNLASEIVDHDLTVRGEVTEIEENGDTGRVTCELTVASGATALMRTVGVVELPARS